nr:unnamed protein product [Callosobruchus chinensis]
MSLPEPLIVRPDGNITIFGLNNHFPLDMPNKLLSIVAPDEYQYTIIKLNKELDGKLSFNIKVLFASCICLCCTLGLSICAPMITNQRAKQRVETILDEENKRLYNKLGLNWSLDKHGYGPPPAIEYVLKIDFLQKPKLCSPD